MANDWFSCIMLSNMLFTELSLHDEVLRGVESAGFEECTEVQEKAIPAAIQGRDVTVQSQTGSGKTAAFLLPIFHRYITEAIPTSQKTLIIAPTRELADQIYQEAKLLGSSSKLRFAVCYGGVGYNQQEKELADDPHMIIGTPGRIMDHAKSRRIDFSTIGVLIIDEADRMFDMGFYPDVRFMAQKMPPAGERQTMLFSATLSVKVMNLAWEYMKDPVEIEVDAEQITVDTIEQKVYHVGKNEKMRFLFGLLEKEKPRSCIIFTNTKRAAEDISRRLSRKGYTSEFIMGDLPQSKRTAIIKRVKAGELPILVATDVAARGLHVNDLELVINYDVPEDPENYVHRIGRTARAGKSGRAVMLACERFVFGLPAIEDYINYKIPVEPVTEDLLAQDVPSAHQRPSHPTHSGGDTVRRSKPSRTGNNRGSRDSVRPSVAGNQPSSKPAKPDQKMTDSRSAAKKQQQTKRPSAAAKTAPAKAAKPAKHKNDSAPPKGNRNERLEYYKQKYGENFKVTDTVVAADVVPETEKKKGVFSALKRLLKKKD